MIAFEPMTDWKKDLGRAGKFFTGLLQRLEDRPVARPVRRALAPDDIVESRLRGVTSPCDSPFIRPIVAGV
jgi:hypothetical protein